MSKKLLALLGLAVLGLGGCMPAIQFSEVSPKIDQYHPKSVVVLPFTNSIGMESANDQTNAKVVKALSDTGYFDRVVTPADVKNFFMQNQSAIEVVTKYRTVWTATGMSDPKLSAWIGKAFHVDSIVFGEVTTWAEEATPSHHIYDAGLALRWADAPSGEALWKCSEALELYAGNPCIFDCSKPEKVMDMVMQIVMQNWPGMKKS